MKYLLILLVLFISCSAPRLISEKAYISSKVEPTITGTYYLFINLNCTYGREFFMHDTAMCKVNDTIVIKDYKRGFIGKKQTLFINYKN